MFKQFITIAVIALGCSALLAQAHSPAIVHNVYAHPAQPDLRIKQYLFSPANDKVMKVHVVNMGNAASGLCILRLTVRKINGVAVGRVKEIKLPPLRPGADKWLIVDAKSILPNNISLESTTFKLNADATEIVAESDETNNELWHNL
jgi:CARDB